MKGQLAFQYSFEINENIIKRAFRQRAKRAAPVLLLDIIRRTDRMPCYSPVQTPTMTHYFPCGHCPSCLKAYSDMWAQRMMDEYAANNGIGCMICLTYSPENLPEDGELKKSDFQDFMKRLRYYIAPQKVRYFMCGEYGGKFGRPHYHAVLFGWIPEDLKPFGYKNYFGSKKLESIWSKGFVHVILEMNFDTVKYNAKYLNKLKPDWHDQKAYTAMSRRPGIGASVVSPEMLLTGTRWIDGKNVPVPRYYLDRLEQDGYNVDVLRKSRSYYLRDAYGEGLTPAVEDQARYESNLLRQGKKRYTIHI